MSNKFLFGAAVILWLSPLLSFTSKIPDSDRAAQVRAEVWPRLKQELKNAGLRDDQPVYIRIFKDPGVLELWVKDGARYKKFKTYLICYFSGGLGTKTKSGDGKSPEGFYTIKPNQLNPVSNYHLAINVGYPNLMEQQRGYTGDAIMIHGHCASIGCYAMTDPIIDEIFTMVFEAFSHGQKQISLDIYPFKMDAEHLQRYSTQPYLSFWKNMKPGYDLFEQTHVPATVAASNKGYVFKRAG